VWKTLDWSLEKCIEEPFKNCTGTTHILRLNWSPDGQLLISAHALNNGAPTAQVIDRGNKWSTKLDFVGHRKAVTTVVCIPFIIEANTPRLKLQFLNHKEVFSANLKSGQFSICQNSLPMCIGQ
jgi:protein HIRA/HIR1